MTQKRPSLCPDQLLRIEALRIASATTPQTTYFGKEVVARAETYLAFLKAKDRAPKAPKPSSPKRKK